MDPKPSFALLIGKRIAAKNGDAPPSSEDHAKDLGIEDTEEQSAMPQHRAMEDSAVADLLSALKTNNVEQAKAALKDFIELIRES